MPLKPFLEQVERFNGFVKNGEDKEFHRILEFNKGLSVKKAPFYAIECCPKIHHTMGGVHGASRLGTVAVIDALTFGMIAGEEFAKMA